MQCHAKELFINFQEEMAKSLNDIRGEGFLFILAKELKIACVDFGELSLVEMVIHMANQPINYILHAPILQV